MEKIATAFIKKLIIPSFCETHRCKHALCCPQAPKNNLYSKTTMSNNHCESKY